MLFRLSIVPSGRILLTSVATQSISISCGRMLTTLHSSDATQANSKANFVENFEDVKQLRCPAAGVIPHSVLKKALDDVIPCPVHSELVKLSPLLSERVFFYNEKNPHVGLIFNIKEHIFNHYNMVGPIKSSWYDILCRHSLITSLLFHHLRETEKSEINHMSIGSLAQLIEGLEKKRCISSCKYEKLVREKEGRNWIQFKGAAVLPKELIVLQVLAHFAHYDYEVI